MHLNTDGSSVLGCIVWSYFFSFQTNQVAKRLPLQSCFTLGKIVSVHRRSGFQILDNLQESLMQSSRNIEVVFFMYLHSPVPPPSF